MPLKEVVQKLRRMSTYRRLWNLTVTALSVRSSSVIVVKMKKEWIVRKRARLKVIIMYRNENDGNTFVLSVEFQCAGKMMIIQLSLIHI